MHLATDRSSGETAAKVRRDNATRAQALANVLMVGFGIELRIGQHQAEGRTCSGHIQQPGQRRGVATRSGMGPLRQQNLLLQIRNDQPLQPATMGRPPVCLLFDAAEEERADSVLRQPLKENGEGRCGLPRFLQHV